MSGRLMKCSRVRRKTGRPSILAKVFFSAPPKRSALPAAGMMTQYLGIAPDSKRFFAQFKLNNRGVPGELCHGSRDGPLYAGQVAGPHVSLSSLKVPPTASQQGSVVTMQ